MKFTDLAIISPIQTALKEAGYETPTPIQAQSITPLLAGRDLLGCAQTGTGKTASFAIPILQHIYNNKLNDNTRRIQAVVLAPTRELAIQIEENFVAYARHTDIKSLVIYGGVPQKSQTRALQEGVDVLIATPGRMLDLYNQKFLKLNDVKYFVLDEADSMLDMGMIQDVKRIVSHLPKQRQNIFFSATMPKEISKLADSMFNNPVKVEVAPVSSTTETVAQSIYFVSKKQKINLLIDLLKRNPEESVLVFSRTKHGANKITDSLMEASIKAAAIHGNKSQNARQFALDRFKQGKIQVLVATDIAARGIDISELPCVINYDLPEVPETYVHRIGRTGRAGNSGRAISFCSIEEKNLYISIERLTRKKITVVADHEFAFSANDAAASPKDNNRNSKSTSGRTYNQSSRNKDNRQERFGKRSNEGRSENFGRRNNEDRSERFGKRSSEGRSENFGRRNNEDRFERFGKRSTEGRTENFGRRSNEDRSERFGKRSSEGRSENFGRRSNEGRSENFGRRNNEDRSERFGKRSSEGRSEWSSKGGKKDDRKSFDRGSKPKNKFNKNNFAKKRSN